MERLEKLLLDGLKIGELKLAKCKAAKKEDYNHDAVVKVCDLLNRLERAYTQFTGKQYFPQIELDRGK